MRAITTTTAFSFLVLCGTTHIVTQSNQLNGTWVPVKLEINGNPLPGATFEKQKLIISDTLYTLSQKALTREF